LRNRGGVIGGVTGFVERYELTTMLVSSGSSASASARIRIEPKIISGSQPSKAVIIGRASWYGRAAAGHKTATGERLDPSKLTAACRQLPLQSRAVVTNLENGRSVGVRINDCGPYTKGRQIDVSKRAAEKLDMADRGTAPVKIQPIATPLVQYIALTLNRGDGKLIQVGRTIRVSQRTRDEQRPRCDTSWRGILVTG
jgi:rare lipoprotein A